MERADVVLAAEALREDVDALEALAVEQGEAVAVGGRGGHVGGHVALQLLAAVVEIAGVRGRYFTVQTSESSSNDPGMAM